MNGVRGVEEGVEAQQGRERPAGGGEKRAIGTESETQRADACRIIELQHIVDVAIRFLRQDFLTDSALNEDATPAIALFVGR